MAGDRGKRYRAHGSPSWASATGRSIVLDSPWNGSIDGGARIAALIVALGFTIVTTPLVIAALRWVRLMDHPNERSSHAKATVRGAGWGVLFGVATGWFVAGPDGELGWWLPVCAVGYGLIGFVDDLRSLPASVRFGAQLAVSAATVVSALALELVSIPVAVAFVAVVGVVAYVNAFNFMDGVNSIAGLQATVVGAALAAGADRVQADDVQIAGLALAGASLGFLPFNAVAARCFLGDVGSYFIGAWVAITMVLAYDRGIGAVALASFVAVYAADTAFTLVRRVRSGQRWWTPHREHVYQRLTDLGLGHLGVGVLVSTFTALSAVLGLLSISGGAGVDVMVVTGVTVLCAGYLVLPSIVARRRSLLVTNGQHSPASGR